jgi:hypothetical protein
MGSFWSKGTKFLLRKMNNSGYLMYNNVTIVNNKHSIFEIC